MFKGTFFGQQFNNYFESLMQKCTVHTLQGALSNKDCLFVVQLNHHLFEELASDVYDEIDRRECDSGIVLDSLQQKVQINTTLVFLSVTVEC